jgi:hypothetical protein
VSTYLGKTGRHEHAESSKMVFVPQKVVPSLLGNLVHITRLTDGFMWKLDAIGGYIYG